jgi:uncharacterized membrane protein
MAQDHAMPAGTLHADRPTIRTITVADLRDVLAKGYDDFAAMPSHAVFLCVVFPIIGLVMAGLTLGYELLWLIFPLLVGFALVGPVAAIGLYELSRRRERGLEVSIEDALNVLQSPSIWSIAALGIMLLMIFIAWLLAAQAIYYFLFNSFEPQSIGDFVRQIFTTREGWTLIIVGNLVGLFFAVLAFVLSVVSIPLLLDRHVSAAGAAATSIRAVLANPVPMAVWALIVGVGLGLGSLPLLLGLTFVMPVLGHATWHLYRKVVEPELHSRADEPRPPKGRHYAAEFPAALFASAEEIPPEQGNPDVRRP